MDPPFLISALDTGEWSASRPGRFTPRQRTPDNHWLGGCVGPQTLSGRCGQKQNRCPDWNCIRSIEAIARRYPTSTSFLC
jgi:hypothetical protein